MNTGIKAGNVAELGNAMGGLKRSVASQERKGVFRDEELVKTKKLIADYDEARMFYDKALGGLKDVKSYKKMMEEHCDAVRDKTEQNGNKVVNYTDGDIGAVLSKVEEQMYEAFPVGRSGKDFINISRESVIRDSFANTYDKLNIKPNEKLDAVRSRSRKGSYQNRL